MEGDMKVLSLCLGDDRGHGRLVVGMDMSLKSFQYLQIFSFFYLNFLESTVSSDR